MTTPTTTMQHAAAASLVMARLADLDMIDLTPAECADLVPALLDVCGAVLVDLLGDKAETYAATLAMDLMADATEHASA